MIGVERVQQALRVVAATAYVTNGSGPVSANVIAPSDAGKTTLILSCQPPGARVLTDFTYAALIQLVTNEKDRPRFVVVPDFNVVVSHKPQVATLTMAIMLALMGEGINEIPGVDDKTATKIRSVTGEGIRIALLTSMTPDVFRSRRGQWRKTGLLRRMLPLYYGYAPETELAIQRSIATGGDALAYVHKPLPPIKPGVVAIDQKAQDAIMALSEVVTRRQLVWTTRTESGDRQVQRAADYPFSPHKTLRQLARGAARLRGASKVTRADLDVLADVVKFVRYDRPEEI